MQKDELIGAVLDRRYRIERKLGEGGMGMVYLGVHERTGRKCAVKLLPPEAAEDPDAVKRFEREARVLGALGHPGIVGIHDFSETPDGRPFFVMDYLEGEDLASRLERVGRLDWEDAKRVVDEIAQALWAAHQAGVFHRDLKPGNVFLARSPAALERVVLLDFGLAKGGVTDSMTLTRSNVVMGTPLYMAPEQARSEKIDARSDIYSLAALTFELLAGSPPFSGPSYTAVLAKLLTDPPPLLSDRAPVPVPAHLNSVLEVGLSKLAEHRQPDVAAFATAVLQERPPWADVEPEVGGGVAPTLHMETGADPAVLATVQSGPPGAKVRGDSASLPMAPTVASSPSEVLDIATDIAEPERPDRGRRSLLLPVVIGLLLFGGVGAVVAYQLGRQADHPGASSNTASVAGQSGADASGSTSPDLEDAAPAQVIRQDAGGQGGAIPIGAETSADAGIGRRGPPTAASAGRRGVGRRRAVAGPRSGASRAGNNAMAPAGSGGSTGSTSPSSTPARRSSITAAGVAVSGMDLLYILMKRKDYVGCARTALRQTLSLTGIEIALSCAGRARRSDLEKRICKMVLAKHASTRVAKRCRGLISAFEARRLRKEKRLKHRGRARKKAEERRLRQERRRLRKKRSK